MILEGILVGILGNGAYDLIKKIAKELLGDIDDELVNKIYDSFEKSSKVFFSKYKSEFGIPSSSFLARQENIDLILKNLYYDSDIDLLQDLCRKGFDGAKDVSEEGIKFFVCTLEQLMKEDFKLNKILTEKRHIKEAKKIFDMLNQFTQQENMQTQEKTNKPKWEMFDNLGKKLPFKEGEKYTQRFPNGVEITFMIKDNLVYVDYMPDNGLRTYYELDFDGNVKNVKFPHNLNEYTFEVPEEEIIESKIKHFPNGYYQKTYILKWNRQAILLYDKADKIQAFELKGGWYISHQNKKITISDIGMD